jgi:type I restriction enzyme S subunit
VGISTEDAVEVPSRWNVRRFSEVARVVKRVNRPELELLSVYLDRGVIRYSESGGQVHKPSLDLSLYQHVQPGNLVLNNQQAWRGSVGVSKYEGIVSPAYVVCELSRQVNPRYVNSLFRSPLMVDQMVTASKGVGSIQRNLTMSYLRACKVPLPSLEEQGLIVRHLDHAEIRITKAIAAKQDVARLLREQKAVVESGTLFGGGWKTGVDSWFGEVPAGWDVLPARALFAERIERDRADLEMLSVTMARGVVKQSSYLKSDGSKKDQAREDRSQYKVVEPDDLVYNKMRAWQGAAGKSDFQGIVSPAYVVLRPFGGANSDYYGMVLRSRQFAREAERYSYGITSDMWSLRPQHFKIIEFPCPPPSQQAAIVDRCRTQTKKIDLAIEAIETEILLLKEYRTRLISDVVTGKLDVRDEAAKLPEIDPMELATVAVGENGDDEEASDDD